jgi:hypothetical protein
MKIWKSLHRSAIGAALLVASAGCSDGAGNGEARLSLRLTDAPGDVRAAVVTISEIYLQGEGGRLTLMDEPVTTDLAELANTTATLVDEAIVPEGTYGELRFVVTGGYIEVDGAAEGTTEIFASSPDYEGLPDGVVPDGELHMPSLGSSGLKVKLEGDRLEVAGDAKIVLVDFDVAQSFGKEAGGSGRWVMSPVVKGGDITVSGSALVTLRPGEAVDLPQTTAAASLDAFVVVLTNAEGSAERMHAADPDGDGVFEAEFAYLFPGEYTVEVEGPEGLSFATDPVGPIDVTVESGERAAASVTIVQAVAQ